MPRPPRIPRPVLVGLLALLALRLAIAAVLPLGDDEAYYWDWSRHLAAGYVDHPPAIALLIWAARHLATPPAFAIHGVAAVLALATSLGLWMLAREILGRDDAATWSVILFNIIPVFAAGAVLAAPDGPLGVCWVLTLLWAWRAAHQERGLAWLAAGLWLGLGLQSKYTAAVLPVSIGLWLALVPAHRRWWHRPEPYAGLLLGLLLFTPVVRWNAAHDWTSFTAVGRTVWSGHDDVLVFLLLQFVYLAPLMFPALLWALGAAARRGLAGDDRWLFLAATGLPVIIGMFTASLLGTVKGHWPAPGYIAAAIALAGLGTERPWAARGRIWRRAAGAVLGSTVAVTALIHTIPLTGPYLLPPRLDPTVDYYGWPATARQIEALAVAGAHGPFFLAGDHYQLTAQLDFNTHGRYVTTTITGEDQYALWTRWASLRGKDALVVSDERYPLLIAFRKGCGSVQSEPPIRIVRRGRVVRILGLTWCRGFLGRPISPRAAQRTRVLRAQGQLRRREP